MAARSPGSAEKNALLGSVVEEPGFVAHPDAVATRNIHSNRCVHVLILIEHLSAFQQAERHPYAWSGWNGPDRRQGQPIVICQTIRDAGRGYEECRRYRFGSNCMSGPPFRILTAVAGRGQLGMKIRRDSRLLLYPFRPRKAKTGDGWSTMPAHDGGRIPQAPGIQS